jgi:hypothetical protein
MVINLFEIFNKVLITESVDRDKVLNALKRRERIIIDYTSNVPGYEIADGVRYIDPYCLGVGRYQGELCLRAYQPFGDTASSVPNWKIFYLKDIGMWKPTGLINKEVAPNYNQGGDRWMVSVIYNADYRKFGSKSREDIPTEPKQPEIFKTNTEKQMDKLKQQVQSPIYTNVGKDTKTTQDRYKEIKAIANQSLNLYNQAKRKGNQEAAQRALKAFRDAQNISNKYMAIYKKEINNNNISSVANQNKTKTEQNIEQLNK